MISDRAGQYLVEIAKEAIAHYLETGEKLEIPNDYPIELEEKLGVFVTLNKKCIKRMYRLCRTNRTCN